METWFWVDGVPEEGVAATASVPGISVTVVANPGAVDYLFGDGESNRCNGAGTAWSPGASSDCTHIYRRASTVEVVSTILWTGQYWVNGSGPFEVQQAISRTASLTLPVHQAEAIVTD
ncbi:MAG: hypothetical protein ACRDKB_13930 [Actinomycetota bacterium]